MIGCRFLGVTSCKLQKYPPGVPGESFINKTHPLGVRAPLCLFVLVVHVVNNGGFDELVFANLLIGSGR